MKLQYIGPHTAVIVPLPLGGELEVERNGTADFPNSLATQLLEQPSNWKRPGKAKPSAAADATSEPDAGEQGTGEGDTPEGEQPASEPHQAAGDDNTPKEGE